MKKLYFTRLHWLAILCGLLTCSLILSIGLLHQRYAFLTRGFVELPEAIPQGGPRFGLNVALEQYDTEELTATLEQLTKLNVRHLKQTFYLPANRTFDWSNSERLITAVAEYPSLELTVLLNGDPAQDFAPPTPEQFAAWAGEFAQRYGDYIDHYIIWDEPNLSTQWGNEAVNPAAYGALLSAAAQAIRTADSTAVIIAAPLAPTTERGPQNLADALYLQRLYEAGAQDAFDVVAGKPYGFDTSAADLRADIDILNFRRPVLLREVLIQNGDSHKAVWAGNWGWNSLPSNWNGQPSVWGQTDEQTQINQTIEALFRAREEWPWMGIMFLEGWEANAPVDDARHGFDLAHRPDSLETLAEALARFQTATVAYPGFHPTNPDNVAQSYQGGWEFSPEYGADMSEVAEGATPDQVTFAFWGTHVGLQVRRANFRARFYIEIDGEPANALPLDNGRAALLLTTADPNEDYIHTELVAEQLEAGPHTMTIIADRGWDQWALKGFSVGYQPYKRPYQTTMTLLAIVTVLMGLTTLYLARQANWQATGIGQIGRGFKQSQERVIAISLAMLVALTGWLTWGAQAAGVYRRLDDTVQFALIAGSAAVFYITPWLFVYLAALIFFFLFVYARPSWGVAIIAFSLPFYVPQVLKPIYVYRFSPVEIFTLVTFAAVLLATMTQWRQVIVAQGVDYFRHGLSGKLTKYDAAVGLFFTVATLSLLFTERLDVATNEWRLVIFEPILLYIIMRLIKPNSQELWRILDAFALGGVAVAVIGLWQYTTGSNLIEAEAGLMRLRSIYGSPNNVALYLGRVLPLLVALLLMGQATNPIRRWLYTAAAVPVSLAIFLSFSKGALLLGVPAMLLFLFVIWQKKNKRPVWPWLVAAVILTISGYMVALQIPQLAGRLDLTSNTGVFRLNLWRSSLNMIREHPWFGVGLDNFLYAYRGRYILAEAWQEPNLNHPHNFILDFATRLGLLGLLSGIWLFGLAFKALWEAYKQQTAVWQPAVLGLAGAMVHAITHGIVDHSFFLVDLAFAFFLIFAIAIQLEKNTSAAK